MLLDVWPCDDDPPAPDDVFGDVPGKCVVLVEFGDGPLDDLLELPLVPPDLRCFVVGGMLDVDAVELDEWVPVGTVDTDTVRLVVEPPDAEVALRFGWVLVVIAFSEAEVDAVLW